MVIENKIKRDLQRRPKRLNSHIEYAESLLQGRGYVKSSYKGGTLYAKGFVYVIIKDGLFTVGHDINMNKYHMNGYSRKASEIAGLLIALNYFERI